MQKIILLSILIGLSSLVFGQSTEISSKYDKIDKFDKEVAFVHKNGLIGLINSKGKEVIKPEYEKISAFGSDNIAYTTKGGLIGLIEINGKVLVDNKYDKIGSFKNNQAIVKKGDVFGVIDKTGKVIVDVKYNKLVFEKNGILKAVNADGSEVLIKPNK